MPTVSIIIPAYNAEKTILETIQSLQNQTFSDFEVIVVNDGSTDKTLEVLTAIADPRLRVVSHANSGVAVTRNRGIAEARGELIAFVDADDLWTADKLESQVTALQQHPEAGVAYSWTTFIDQQGRVLFSQEPIFETGNIYPRLLVGNITSNGSNILARRQFVEAVGGFDSEVRPAEDWDYCIRLAALCPFVVVPKHQILYRQMARSHSSKVDVMERCSLAIIEKSFKVAPAELQYLKRKSLGNTYRYLTKLCLIHTSSDTDICKADEMLNKAIRVYPKSLLDRQIQRLFLEVKLMRLLSYKTSVHFEQFLAKLFPKFAGKFLLLVNQESVKQRV